MDVVAFVCASNGHRRWPIRAIGKATRLKDKKKGPFATLIDVDADRVSGKRMHLTEGDLHPVATAGRRSQPMP